jgi:hypothetical protein
VLVVQGGACLALRTPGRGHVGGRRGGDPRRGLLVIGLMTPLAGISVINAGAALSWFLPMPHPGTARRRAPGLVMVAIALLGGRSRWMRRCSGGARSDPLSPAARED